MKTLLLRRNDSFIKIIVGLLLIIFILNVENNNLTDIVFNIHPIERFEEQINDVFNNRNIATKSKIDKIMFAGDFYLTNRLINSYEENGVEGILDKNYVEYFNKADLNVVNLECAMTENDDKFIDKKYFLKTPPKYVSALKSLNIGLCSLANNHSMDYGDKGMMDTLKVLSKNSISYIGAGENLEEAKKSFIKYIDGKCYGFVAGSIVVPSDEFVATKEKPGVFSVYSIDPLSFEIKKLKEKVDKVIVYMHWGNELDYISNDTQKAMAQNLIIAGADLIVGTHPHVPQEIEYFLGKPIVYSLGNFIFGTTARLGNLLEVSFDYNTNEKGDIKLKVIPIFADYTKTIKPSNQDIRNEYEMLNQISRNCSIDYRGYVTPVETTLNNVFEQTMVEN